MDDPILNFISEIEPDNQQDIISILNFLGTMAIGCKNLKLDDLSKLYSERLNQFVILLHKFGYKNTRRLKGVGVSGLQTLLTKAFYNLRIFNG